MAASWIRRGWVEAGFVRDSGPHCLGHFVIDFEDYAFGAVFAMLFLILTLDDGKCVHNIGDSVTRGREMTLEPGEFLRGLVTYGTLCNPGGFP